MVDQISRRDFIDLVGLVGMAAAVDSLFGCTTLSQKSKTGIGQLRGGYFDWPLSSRPKDLWKAQSLSRKYIFDLNLRTGQLQKFKSSSAAHVVETHPYDSSLSVVGAKRSENISTFNWKTGKEINVHSLSNSSVFYGHIAFSSNGQKILAPILRASGDFEIGIFELAGLKQIDSVILGRRGVHDICPLGDDLFITGVSGSKGNQSAFGVFDLNTKKMSLYESEFGSVHDSWNVSHLKDGGDRFFASTQISEAGVSMKGTLISFDRNTFKVKTEIKLEESLFPNEMLSLEFDENNRNIWISLPFERQIIVWNIDSSRLVKKLEFSNNESPTAITSYSDAGLVLVSTDKKILAFDARSIKSIETPLLKAAEQLIDGGYCAHTRFV